jgi:ABC-type arginine transport system permease subunit
MATSPTLIMVAIAKGASKGLRDLSFNIFVVGVRAVDEIIIIYFTFVEKQTK